jgi:lipoprotein-anchoring transpeptidase ErfK/SrfK
MSRTGRAIGAALTIVLLQVPIPAHADRFGPPWMDRVTADSTTLYTTLDRSQPTGALLRDTIVVVLGQQDDMIQVPDGWVAAADLAETTAPWVAEVSDPSVSVYAYPDLKSTIRRSGQQGDLFRVTGVSLGVGNNDIWWATTEGYVGLGSIRPATSAWAKQWTLPTVDLAPLGWWGLASAANARVGPSADAPSVGELSGGEHVKVLESARGQEVDGDPTWYRIDGGRFAGAYVHASLVQRIAQPEPTVLPPPADTQLGDKPWIVVDRTSHTLTLLRNGNVQFVTYVSLGRAGVDTPQGDYTTWGKYRADRMSNAANADADHLYDLPNVPFVQYYKHGGFAIHGAYWHDQFGTDESQGCINLTWTDAAYLFGQTVPQLAADAGESVANSDHPEATPVEILGT